MRYKFSKEDHEKIKQAREKEPGQTDRQAPHGAREAVLAPFKEQAEKGELVEVLAIESACREAVGHSIGSGQIYYVLRLHGWRKVMPRSRYPKKASGEVIETSKKLKQSSGGVFHEKDCAPFVPG